MVQKAKMKWQNKSALEVISLEHCTCLDFLCITDMISNRYQWISHNQLTSLPIQLISAPGGLIVVWVTNKTKLRDFVHDTLFPSWNVATVGEWHWIKVFCCSSWCVDPIDSPILTSHIGHH